LDDICKAIHWWMIEYNEERPHDLLGDSTPIDYVGNYTRNSTLELCGLDGNLTVALEIAKT
jgi:putative transposase